MEDQILKINGYDVPVSRLLSDCKREMGACLCRAASYRDAKGPKHDERWNFLLEGVSDDIDWFSKWLPDISVLAMPLLLIRHCAKQSGRQVECIDKFFTEHPELDKTWTPEEEKEVDFKVSLMAAMM